MTTLRADRGEPARVSAHSAIKLRVPPPPACNLPRQRLIDQLDAAGPEGVVVVHGPAGSGKTSLVADWASSLARPVSWLTLDERDRVGGGVLDGSLRGHRPGATRKPRRSQHAVARQRSFRRPRRRARHGARPGDRRSGDPRAGRFPCHCRSARIDRHVPSPPPASARRAPARRRLPIGAGAVARSGATRWSTGHGRLRRSAVLRDRGRRAAPSPDARRRRGVDQRHDRPRRWVGRGSPAVRSRVTVRGVGDPDHRGLPDG